MFLYYYLFYCCVVMLMQRTHNFERQDSKGKPNSLERVNALKNVNLLLLCLIEMLLACFLKPSQHTHTCLGYCTCRPGRSRYLCAAQWHDQRFRLIWEAEPSANQPFLMKSYSSYSWFYFHAHSVPQRTQISAVPGARRGGGRECSARWAGLGCPARGQSCGLVGCCRCLGGVSLY